RTGFGDPAALDRLQQEAVQDLDYDLAQEAQRKPPARARYRMPKQLNSVFEVPAAFLHLPKPNAGVPHLTIPVSTPQRAPQRASGRGRFRVQPRRFLERRECLSVRASTDGLFASLLQVVNGFRRILGLAPVMGQEVVIGG